MTDLNKPVLNFSTLSSAERDEVAKMVKETSNLKFQIESSNEAIKGYRERAKAEFGIEPKEFNQFVSLYHSDTRDEYEEKHTSILEKYDILFKTEAE